MRKVTKLNRRQLETLIDGESDKTHIVKFYSNTCAYCRNLQPYYEDLAKEYEQVNFHVFNMDDGEGLEKALRFDGVPTIFFFQKEKKRLLPDPGKPNKLTWYPLNYIRAFVNNELGENNA